jgi:hypothetical protein
LHEISICTPEVFVEFFRIFIFHLFNATRNK